MVDLFKLIVGLCLLAVVSSQSAPTVSTQLGSVKGSILKTAKNADIYAFRGIRYAQAPVGSLRFKPPVAVTKWETELDATKDGFMCPQSKISEELLSEDCLILNVYSRDLTGNRSVIVYIHGGGNFAGSSHSEINAAPKYIMDKNIVLVAMNYRLGALGYLSTLTADAPGNYGYLDQVMALQWVHDHISNFGGNPESVTILGLSSGAMAVTVHMSSPLSEGLFHRAIAVSGSATNHFHIDNLHWTTQLARQTSCPMYNPVDVLSCLRNVSWQTIISVCNTWALTDFPMIRWNYQIDGHFLKDYPTNIFADGKFHKVPLLTGITKDELTYILYGLDENSGLLNDMFLNFDKYGPELFMYGPDTNSDDLKTFYLGNQKINEKNLTNYGEIFSDMVIRHGVHRLVELARKYVNVYYYRFDYVGRYGAIVDADGKPRGVSHADDFELYVIKKYTSGQIGFQDPEWFMVERMVGWFSTFAQKGLPGGVGAVSWLPSNKKKVQILYNDKEVHMGDEPYQEKFEFLDKLFPIARSGSSTIHAAGMLTGIAVILNVLSKKTF